MDPAKWEKSWRQGFKYGYQVAVGSDHPEKLSEFGRENPNIEIRTFEQAARSGEIVVLCVKGTAAEKVVEKVKDELSGKTVIDATNPIADAPPENGVLKFFTILDNSLMERLQRIAPSAHFVKALNSIGSTLMINPDFRGVKPTMFICGTMTKQKRRQLEC